MEEAEVILYLFDVQETEAPALKNLQQEWKAKGWKYVMAGNKIDRASELEIGEKFSGVEGLIYLSAQKLQHLDVLKEKLIDMVLQDTVGSESTIVTNARHYHSLLQVSGALDDVLYGLAQNIPGDLLALDIRRCLHYLGEITGEITTEDQLDYIFSKFCIGK
jgi:tRNA modification GTPase